VVIVFEPYKYIIPWIVMKKLQLKIPANKKRLQINRAPHPSPPVFEPKIEVLK
jgi:hypothetical protein